MIESKNFKLLVILATFLLPSIFFLIGPAFPGHDSYFYYYYVCDEKQEHNVINDPIQGIQQQLFNALPCNEFELKILIILLYGISLFFLWGIGEYYSKNHGYLTMLFAVNNPILFGFVFKLENDIFALPLVYAGLYFFLRFREEKRTFLLLISLLFLGGATFVWGGAIYYLMAFSLLELLLIPISLFLLFNYYDTIINSLIPNQLVKENSIFLGLTYLFFYAPFIYLSKNISFPHQKLFFILVLLGVLNAKFFVLALPLLALSLVKVFKEKDEQLNFVMVSMALIVCVVFSISFLPIDSIKYAPKFYEHQAVKDLVFYSNLNNKETVNDWEFGHMVWFYGGKTKHHSGFNNSFEIEKQTNAIVLTRHEMSCPAIKQYENNLLGYNLTLYDCL